MRNTDMIKPSSYVYWQGKEQFQLTQDTYSNWTMFAVEDGQFSYMIGDHKGTAEFGDVVVCPPGIPFHRQILTPLTFHFFHFSRITETNNNLSTETNDQSMKHLIGKLSVTDTERLASTYRYMRAIGSIYGEDAQYERMQHMLNDLWLLVDIYWDMLEEDWDERDADPIMQTARQWLLTHAFEPLIISQLSELLNITPVQLTRRFRASYRKTPSQFITSLRLERACLLLEETSLSLEAIAHKCGYENGFYFSRIFRSKKGMAPSAYRKLHRM